MKETTNNKETMTAQMTTLIQQEVVKYMSSAGSSYLNMVDSAGKIIHYALNAFNLPKKGTWIVDTRASSNVL